MSDETSTRDLLYEPGSDEGVLWLTWLVRLRWVAILAQIVTLSFSFTVLASSWLLLPLGLVMLLVAIANIEAISALRSGREITQGRLLGHLAIEIVALTIFLAAAGGPSNPFAVLFLIHVCMGAVMLTWGKATLITSLVLVCYAGLYPAHVPLRLENHTLPEDVLLGLGTAMAFVITAISATGFTIGVARTLRGHKLALLEARDRTAKVDRLRTVGTLAAGAAHELNTPLFTMNLRLRRIRRRFSEDQDTMRDAQAIQSQLDRCKEIVDQLLVGAGDPSASGIERRKLGEMVRQAAHLWGKGAAIDVTVHDSSSGIEVEVPPVAFRQALINLLENGREAQSENGNTQPLLVRVEEEGNLALVRVRDHGCGLPEQPGRVGDPFYTTKDTGTGLGVYVARAVADGAGGGLRYRDAPGEWTEAIWWFPIARDDGRPGRHT